MRNDFVPYVIGLFIFSLTGFQTSVAQNARVDFVEPALDQPHHDDSATIWFDDFDTDQQYLEPAPNSPAMRFSADTRLGSRGRSMESYFAKGQRGLGGRKVIFGDAPFGRPLRNQDSFDEVFWRYYVKYPIDWQGGGEAKHSRAIVFSGPRWAQASILHVWTSGSSLTLDPVCAVKEGTVLSKRYNDFDSFSWLGNSPKGRFQFHHPTELARWVCLEVRWKLNTPGKSDGIAQMWVDGVLDAERTGMSFRETYSDRGINAVFLESYWNRGSPIDQHRWFDNFVVSTKPIGPISVHPNPTVHPKLSANASHWQLEVIDRHAKSTLWKSGQVPRDEKIAIDHQTGQFLVKPDDKTGLAAGQVVKLRVREKINGQWTPWSPPHWPVHVLP